MLAESAQPAHPVDRHVGQVVGHELHSQGCSRNGYELGQSLDLSAQNRPGRHRRSRLLQQLTSPLQNLVSGQSLRIGEVGFEFGGQLGPYRGSGLTLLGEANRGVQTQDLVVLAHCRQPIFTCLEVQGSPGVAVSPDSLPVQEERSAFVGLRSRTARKTPSTRAPQEP